MNVENKFPKRKSLRLKGYDYSAYNEYFVTICTHKRQHIFGEIKNAQLMPSNNEPDKIVTKWLLKIEENYTNVKIDKYVVMSDHIHFIICNYGDFNEETLEHKGVNLSQIIQWFKTKTTNEYIRGVKSGLYSPFNGHLWQRGFYEHIIEDDEDYNDFLWYIENNPAKSETDIYYKKLIKYLGENANDNC